MTVCLSSAGVKIQVVIVKLFEKYMKNTRNRSNDFLRFVKHSHHGFYMQGL